MEDNYLPVNENKCETCAHHKACLRCCHYPHINTTTEYTSTRTDTCTDTCTDTTTRR